MLLIARTDSEAAKLISSTVDASDHEFINGTTTKGRKSLAEVLAEAEVRGASGLEGDKLEKEWMDSHKICTFDQGGDNSFKIFTLLNVAYVLFFLFYIAVEKEIKASKIRDKSAAYQHYLSAVAGKSNNEAREIAKDVLGESVFWDWDCELHFLDIIAYQ